MESKARNKSVKRSQSPNTSKPVKKQPKLNPIKVRLFVYFSYINMRLNQI